MRSYKKAELNYLNNDEYSWNITLNNEIIYSISESINYLTKNKMFNVFK